MPDQTQEFFVSQHTESDHNDSQQHHPTQASSDRNTDPRPAPSHAPLDTGRRSPPDIRRGIQPDIRPRIHRGSKRRGHQALAPVSRR